MQLEASPPHKLSQHDTVSYCCMRFADSQKSVSNDETESFGTKCNYIIKIRRFFLARVLSLLTRPLPSIF